MLECFILTGHNKREERKKERNNLTRRRRNGYRDGRFLRTYISHRNDSKSKLAIPRFIFYSIFLEEEEEEEESGVHSSK